MKVSFLTTFRKSDEYRLANLERVISQISTDFPDWEIIVVEQDAESTLSTHPVVDIVKYVTVCNPGRFNKSWGMNVAFQESSGEILVICDADMIVQAVDLQRAVSACEKELDAVRPYGRLIDMTEGETERYMLSHELPDAPEKERGYDRAHAYEALCMAGGIYIIRREFFKCAGGMDENFSGWGGEDDAMSIKLQGLSSKVAIAKNALAWHLWHPREERYSHAGYQDNRRRLQQYQFMSRAELSVLSKKQSHALGDKEKFLDQTQQNDAYTEPSESAKNFTDIDKLLPEGYGKASLSTASDFVRKFGIVISSCGRPEYLKQCLASVKKSDLSQAVVCIIDETEAAKTEVDGFTCFEGIDSPDMDIRSVGSNIDTILSAVEQETACNLFNEMGWLKHSIRSVARIRVTHPRHGLYIRNSYLDEHPGLRDELNKIASRPDTEVVDFLNQFSIPNVPVIKIFKHRHRNMFDSLRAGWDLLGRSGCEFLVNLDADAIVNSEWLNRLQLLYDKYKNQQAGSRFIVTGFNTLSHGTRSRADEYEIKHTVGGINLFFHHSLYQEIVRPVLTDIDWDHALSEKITSISGSIVAAVPSVVQHVGESGLWSRPGKYDVSEDFNE